MRKHLSDRLVLFLLVVSALFSFAPAVQAAPGDFLFLWGAQQHLSDATAVAVDGAGNVFVTTADDIQVFNSSGIRIKRWGTYGSGDGQVSNPTGIAVDQNGRVYVADTGNDRVEVFTSDGAFLANWRNPEWSTRPPTAIATDRTGHVYVVAGGKINVFDSDGHFVREVSTTHIGNITTDSNGNLYVVYNTGWATVDVFSPAGDLIKTEVLDFPYGSAIAVTADGTIYVSGNDSGDSQFIAVFDSAWTHIRYLTFGIPHIGIEHYWIPIALATDAAGNLYTVDEIDDGVIAFDNSGNVLPQWWTYGLELGQFSVPQGLAFGSSGNLYETDGFDENVGTSNDTVQAFTADGRPLFRKMVAVCETSSLAINGSNNVYVLDSDSAYGSCNASAAAVEVDASGNVVRKLGTPIPNQNFFGIAVAQNGNFVVTDTGNSVIRVFDEYGALLKVFGSVGSGSGQFQNPEGIAIDDNGNIFISDSGNNRIQMFNSSYTFIRTWGGAGSANGYFSHPAGIATDRAGHVFVADAGNNRIQVFGTSGNFLKSWGTLGDYNGQFVRPRGVAVNSSGTRIYVADTGNNRIEVFQGYATSTYSISGTVRQGSTTGPILAEATVSIAGKTATTTSTGAFSIAGISAGTYTVSVSKSGFITKSITGFVVNSNRSGLVFYLSPAGYTVSGTVRDGSATGPVISGATVSIAGKSCTTGSTGSFSISGLQAGTYTVTISRTGYVTKNLTGFVVNSNRSGLVFYLTRGTYTISGTLRQGSSTGPALSGAKVTIAGKATTTSSTGAFTISGITSGTYTLTFSKSGYLTKTVSGFVVDRNLGALGYYLIGPYSVSGTVREGSATGPVVAGAKVTIDGRSATTGSSGTFSLVGVPGGTFTVTVSKYGYLTTTIPNYFISGNKSGVVFYIKK